MSTKPSTQPATKERTDAGKTRRAILQSAATAIAAPAFLSAQGTNNEIRVGIIGIGGRGSSLLSRIVQVPMSAS